MAESWHHDMHYKVKVKTGEYKFGDNHDKLGEVELSIKVPMLDKENAENIAKIILGQLLNPKHIGELKAQSTEHRPWSITPTPRTKTLDFFKKEVV